MYLSGKNDIIRVKREFHIVENLVIKAFININILKPEDMIFDIEKNVMIIDLCKDIQVFFIFVNHRSQIRITIFNNNLKKMIISSHFNIIIFVSGFKCRPLKLSYNRDFLFES